MKKIQETTSAHLNNFTEFIRKQDVIGLSIGFILGASVSKLVNSLVSDILNPIIGLLLGGAKNLSQFYFQVGEAKIMWGNFLSTMLDFIVLALVVYSFVSILGLDKLEKK